MVRGRSALLSSATGEDHSHVAVKGKGAALHLSREPRRKTAPIQGPNNKGRRAKTRARTAQKELSDTVSEIESETDETQDSKKKKGTTKRNCRLTIKRIGGGEDRSTPSLFCQISGCLPRDTKRRKT